LAIVVNNKDYLCLASGFLVHGKSPGKPAT